MTLRVPNSITIHNVHEDVTTLLMSDQRYVNKNGEIPDKRYVIVVARKSLYLTNIVKVCIFEGHRRRV